MCSEQQYCTAVDAQMAAIISSMSTSEVNFAKLHFSVTVYNTATENTRY